MSHSIYICCNKFNSSLDGAFKIFGYCYICVCVIVIFVIYRVANELRAFWMLLFCEILKILKIERGIYLHYTDRWKRHIFVTLYNQMIKFILILVNFVA